ncbi:MAG TPA: lipocalin family protein [Cyclobacteriaceae bacterium]|nr:lipocalin family protein [Cyclobacteriaceae bacterium]
MRLRLINLVLLIACFGSLTISCKKSDPAPLGAQVNAKYLAGEAGKSKSWKLREFSYQENSNPPGTLTMAGCFADNLYTFSNNDSQDYSATEGTSKCYNSDAIESGTWSFTLDGLTLNIEVDNTQTPNGLFSAEIFVDTDDQDNITAIYNAGYAPFPAFVKKIDDNNLVLEVNRVRGTDTYKFTLTFTPA